MNKQEQINKIAELEKQIHDLKLLVLKEEKVKENDYSWEKCFQKEGYYLDSYSNIIATSYLIKLEEHKNVFRTVKQAKSALAMAQLSHIIWVANGCEELDWNDTSKRKYCISKVKNAIHFNISIIDCFFISFKSDEIRQKVYEQNERLIKDYLMID